jgi:hypothetical protein
VCGRLDIDFNRIQKNTYSQIPPWMMRRIICDRSLQVLPKGIHQEATTSNLAELESNNYDGYIPVFADRSYIEGRTGCAVFFPNEVAKCRLLDDTSIFAAKIYAIHQALLRIQVSTLHDFVI